MKIPEQPRVSLFFGPLDLGGTSRVQLHLANGFSKLGIEVDLIVMRVEDEALDLVPDGVRVFDLKAKRVRDGVPLLYSHLRAHKPDLLMANTEIPNLLACVVRKMAGFPKRLILCTHSLQARNFDAGVPWQDRMVVPWLMRRLYRGADAFITVSDGVAEELSGELSFPKHSIKVIHNPVIDDVFFHKSQEEVDHPWLVKKDCPVFITASRLEQEKDIETLLRAFSRVTLERPARLIVLGKGILMESLITEAKKLNIMENVDFLGFVSNPLKYISKADVFIMSSKREGFGLALVEAMACGVPVVSTNCPSGPAEILKDGKFGSLVPTGDDEMMAKAILRSLDANANQSALVSRAMDFRVDTVARKYVELFMSLGWGKSFKNTLQYQTTAGGIEMHELRNRDRGIRPQPRCRT